MITNERPSDELSGAEAFEAMHARFALMTEAPRQRFSLAGLDVQKLGRFVFVTVKFKEGGGKTFRISREWATALKNELTRVLG